MTPQDINNNFQRTVTIWENLIDDYSDADFAAKPSDEEWSIGQVCQHLIKNTNGFARINIEKCLEGSENEHAQKTEIGETAFAANELPDIQIKVPPSPQYTPPQPESKEAAKNDFKLIEDLYQTFAARVEQSSATAKSQHPVLGFLNAHEWLQLVEMHYRHHLRQIDRINKFLQSRN